MLACFHRLVWFPAVACGFLLGATGANAAVEISSKPTSGMSCASGVCAPTAKNAVLSVTDLQNMLASGSLKIVTKSAGIQAKDIAVQAGFSWASGSALTLDAHDSVTINQPVSDAGTGAFKLTTNDGGSGGTLSFGSKGRVSFLGTINPLTINGNAYTLVSNIKTLASDISANPSGFYALANNYDASVDGIYSSSPIQTTLTGTFEGLGSRISNLTIRDSTDNSQDGLFLQIGSGATVMHVALNAVRITGRGRGLVGSMAALNNGTLLEVHTDGAFDGGGATGGLVGVNGGTIAKCDSHAKIRQTMRGVSGGGLAGGNSGTISESFATGSIVQKKGGRGHGSSGGGLVGVNINTIVNSYASAHVEDDQIGYVGGLIGFDEIDIAHGYVAQSYATGIVSARPGSNSGGLIGYDTSGDNLSYTYWDTTTSGIANAAQCAGNVSNDPGCTGMTSAELQAGLPAGFNSAVWGENANINGGLPYLLAWPPPK